jgi:hypothetical protein
MRDFDESFDANSMRNPATVLLAVAVVILCLFAYSQTAALRQQRQQIRELTTKLDSAPKTASLELQEKCARQAREEFKTYWEFRESADFTDHYNTKLNKCFILIQFVDTKTVSGDIWTYKELFDAFEGKDYAEYDWKMDKLKKYWEVPPIVCKVTLPSGEETICRSSDEFNSLVKQYME